MYQGHQLTLTLITRRETLGWLSRLLVGQLHLRKVGLRILTFARLQGARGAVLLQELLGWLMETGCCWLRARNLISKEAAAK